MKPCDDGKWITHTDHRICQQSNVEQVVEFYRDRIDSLNLIHSQEKTNLKQELHEYQKTNKIQEIIIVVFIAGLLGVIGNWIINDHSTPTPTIDTVKKS